MPPPNITGDLHMGHAMYTLKYVLIRWHRMLGDAALWVPGTDHAAIATQNVLEKQLAKKGSTKEAIGREAWDRLVKQWYETTGHTILQQMRRLGFSADWSRIRFTMDPTYVDAIRYAFVQLWREGLIYRGPRIVNWCPRDQSAISDLEVQYEETDDELYYLDYPVEGGGVISVATARPETMVGDTGVAVHPDDWRYKDLIGKSVMLPVVHRIVPIVADEAVDPEFGTGAVKVTPGHDVTDYDIDDRCATSATGAFRRSCGSATGCRSGPALTVTPLPTSKIRRSANSAATGSSPRTRMFSTPGFPPRCGPTPRLAGRRIPMSCAGSIPRRCSTPPARSFICGWHGWSSPACTSSTRSHSRTCSSMGRCWPLTGGG